MNTTQMQDAVPAFFSNFPMRVAREATDEEVSEGSVSWQGNKTNLKESVPANPPLLRKKSLTRLQVRTNCVKLSPCSAMERFLVHPPDEVYSPSESSPKLPSNMVKKIAESLRQNPDLVAPLSSSPVTSGELLSS
eukprot:GILJ01000475.1.p1 GENE.GILJ01000475.1~~GILJ01000475.1.p1  ORF type:complete len:135 (+),score=15.39 GILJ01000475.1:49-453(+)